MVIASVNKDRALRGVVAVGGAAPDLEAHSER